MIFQFIFNHTVAHDLKKNVALTENKGQGESGQCLQLDKNPNLMLFHVNGGLSLHGKQVLIVVVGNVTLY